MSDKNYFHEPEDISIDDLIAESKEQVESLPGEAVFGDEDMEMELQEQSSAAPEEKQPEVQQEPLLQPEDDFTPDFGDAFDDYGEYTESPAIPMGDYEVGGYAEETDEEYIQSLEDEEPPSQQPKRRHTKRVIPLFVKILLYIVIVGVAAVGLGYGIWECAQDILAFGRSDETLTVSIQEGDTVEDIAQMLRDEGVIKYPWLFEFYCDFTDSNDTMDPGIYVISYNFDYHALVDGMIANSPNRTTVRVMIPEGATAAQIFALMETNNVCTAAELEACAANTEFDYWFLEGIPYGSGNRLEGFLFPDTYDFYEYDEPERVLDKLLSNFNKKFSEEAAAQLEVLNGMLAQRLANAGYDESYIAQNRLSVYDLIIVASMIEKESAGPDESGNIASVIYNRLCSPDFPCLQIDATVVYALGGVENGVTYEDTQIDSPYNTYRYAGLPVGPISNPGLSSITAALYPSDTSYYYYALDNTTGYHHFSQTYDEHNSFLQGQNDGE